MKKAKVLVITSRYNEMVTSQLHASALEHLRTSPHVDTPSITQSYVSGAFELPVVASRAAKSGRFDVILALGCVIRGETPHFEYISQQVASGLMSISVHSGIPTIFGVLTTETLDQALARAGKNFGNKGREAAQAGIDAFLALDQLGLSSHD